MIGHLDLVTGPPVTILCLRNCYIILCLRNYDSKHEQIRHLDLVTGIVMFAVIFVLRHNMMTANIAAS